MSGGDRGEGCPTQVRCIVWHPRGEAPDSVLLATLAKRGFQVEPCDNAYEALAHVCGRGFEGAPADKPPRTALLLNDPERLPAATEVVTLAGRYAQHTKCWMFESRGERRLHAVSQEDLLRWTAPTETTPGAPGVVTIAKNIASRVAPVPAPKARPGTEAGQAAAAALAAAVGGPRLRLSGEGQLPPAPDEPGAPGEVGRLASAARGASENSAPEGGGGSGGSPPLLTEQELEMLLARDPLPGQD